MLQLGFRKEREGGTLERKVLRIILGSRAVLSQRRKEGY